MHMMSREPRRAPEGQLQLPPGFRFYPSDEELVVHYLCRKAASQPFAVPIIAEVDLYKFDPWDLPEKALFGEKEWYFFSPRDRKYPNGSRPNRAAGSGYWKATGTDKPISTHGGKLKVGVKKALVFYTGKAPKGDKTNWIMHEYRLADSAAKAAKRKGSLRLDDWVLCRIYKKLPSATRLAMKEESSETNGFEEVLASLPEIDDEKLVNLPRLSSNTPLMYNNGSSITPRGGTSYFNFNDQLQGPQLQYANYYNNHQFQQMGSSPLADNKPFIIKSPHNQDNMISKPNFSNHESLMLAGLNSVNSIGGAQQAALQFGHSRPTLRVHNLLPEYHDSPVDSSVDEESALPQENTTLPASSSGMFSHMNSGADSVHQLFNFDSLPSPFGRLETFQHFNF